MVIWQPLHVPLFNQRLLGRKRDQGAAKAERSMSPRPRRPESKRVPEPDVAYHERLARFKSDLGRIGVRDVIWKHITTGPSAKIDDEAYFTLRHRVAAQFGIHPSSVIIVGSCKLGFALKFKGEGPARARYEPAGDRNDVDVAVVSRSLFDSLWDTTFELIQRKWDWSLGHGRLFSRDLFNGWISPGELPASPNIPPVREWKEFFEAQTRNRLCGYRKIEGRLYRSWERLEAYQETMVSQCWQELRLER